MKTKDAKADLGWTTWLKWKQISTTMTTLKARALPLTHDCGDTLALRQHKEAWSAIKFCSAKGRITSMPQHLLHFATLSYSNYADTVQNMILEAQ